MSSGALVSIIIPIYKVSAYLDACVKSACEQTYTNLEIILVDDGSPDDCAIKCDYWEEVDYRIKVIHKPNGGLSDARNAGLDIASGKYIYFLDGDDTVKPNLIETALKHMETGADMVAFNWDRVYPNGDVKALYHPTLGDFDLTDKATRQDFIVQQLLTCKIGWEAWSRMYSRDLIERYQLRFADNRRIFAEDLYFCLCYCAHAKRIISIPDRLYCYSIREDSIMGRDSKKLNIDRMNELAKAACEHLKKWDDTKWLVDVFPLLHYLIIDGVLSKAVYSEHIPIEELRTQLINSNIDWNYFKSSMRKLPSSRSALCSVFSGSQTAERLSFLRYILDGNYTALRIRNRLIYQFSDILDRNTKQMAELRNQYKKLSKQHNRIFLIGTEAYGNIGDNQINESVIAFLRKTVPDYAVHEVTAKEWQTHKVFLKKYIRADDLIVFSGGGNFGDVYPAAQKLRDTIIQTWPQNPKIVFPQTIYFSDGQHGAEELKTAQALYTRENRVVLFTRERTSYGFAQEHFNCDCYLVPDIVLSSDLSQEVANRENKIILCFRRDIEKEVSTETIASVEELCKETGMDIIHTDLQLDYHVLKANRRAAIDEKLQLWRSSKLLITDRLHGMVFAAVTGTPCIVFSNYNHKVQGTFEWLKYLPYIRYAKTIDDVRGAIPQLLALDNCHYDITPLTPYFDKLAQEVKEYARN